MEYPVIVFKDEDGVFIARCPVFKGAHTFGMSEEEALQNIKEGTSNVRGRDGERRTRSGNRPSFC